jgi:hypothetical protein
MSEEKSKARAVREEFSPERVEKKLQEVASERPKVKYLLDFSIVGKALAAAAIVAVLLLLIFSPPAAGIGLVVVFFGVWLGLAQFSYDRRRETRDPEADPDESGYAGDRGEVEAEAEQEDEDGADGPARNGSTSGRERAGSSN